MILLSGTPAHAQTWRLSGPDGPRAGESATYTLRGPHGVPYTVKTYGGGRACPPVGLPGDPAQTHAIEGYVDDNGIDVQQISVARGRSTLCVYDDFPQGR